jgi:putative transcriptional regulator
MKLPLSVVCLVWGIWAAAGAAAEPLEPGTLLVARRALPDIRFQEAVVLVVQSNAQGTAGLIINRPSRLALAEALPDLPALSGRQISLSYGGPVAPRSFMALVKAAETPPEPSQKVFATVYLTGVEQLADWLATERPGSRYRVFTGYAGWAPGQLDNEMARGDWQLLPAEETVLFADDVAALWQRLARQDDVAPPH